MAMPHKRPARHVYLTVRKMVDPDTGERVGCLVPRYRCDARTMRERKLSVGTEVRAELKKPRNAKFHRLAHAIGGLVVDQIEGFENLDAHGALKRLQRECGVCCDEQDMEIPGIGRLAVRIPRSIAFDEMDEGEFSGLVAAIYRHIAATYWPSMTEAQIARMVEMYEQESM